MTRINVGIPPHELCDAHLIAEYRELPRAWNGKFINKPPLHFTLGTGHVLWCAQYPGMLSDRFVAIVAEMQYRGFSPIFLTPPEFALISDKRPPLHEVERARPILQERIRSRLSTAKREPKWTNRTKPDWVN